MTFRLPLELVEIVIDNLHDDLESLVACSLISSQFTSRTRFHLFRSVRLQGKKRIRQFRQLNRNPLSFINTSKIRYAVITPSLTCEIAEELTNIVLLDVAGLFATTGITSSVSVLSAFHNVIIMTITDIRVHSLSELYISLMHLRSLRYLQLNSITHNFVDTAEFWSSVADGMTLEYPPQLTSLDICSFNGSLLVGWMTQNLIHPPLTCFHLHTHPPARGPFSWDSNLECTSWIMDLDTLPQSAKLKHIVVVHFLGTADSVDKLSNSLALLQSRLVETITIVMNGHPLLELINWSPLEAVLLTSSLFSALKQIEFHAQNETHLRPQRFFHTDVLEEKVKVYYPPLPQHCPILRRLQEVEDNVM